MGEYRRRSVKPFPLIVTYWLRVSGFESLLSHKIWACMYQGWRCSLARNVWRVRFSSGPQKYDKKKPKWDSG